MAPMSSRKTYNNRLENRPYWNSCGHALLLLLAGYLLADAIGGTKKKAYSCTGRGTGNRERKKEK